MSEVDKVIVEDKFLKFEFIIDKRNVIGPYTLRDWDRKDIGYAEGYTTKRRSIVFELE